MTQPSRYKPMRARWLIPACLMVGFMAPPARSYSVLSHEAIIDAVWDSSLKPVLLQRFPDAAEDDLRKAHAYAYGGAIVQDMGYYPFGSHLFSDLVHYVRSGAFILNELADSKDLDEYAFALGSLSHYAADNVGHSAAVNRAVPMLYRKMRKKYGSEATYEDNPADHLKVEFSFDVAEVAENHYAPQAYHDFIGFQISKPLLERAFLNTYGVELKEIIPAVDLALGTYRHTAASIIPEMTRVAWQAKKTELMRDTPGITKSSFVYAISRSSYEKEWDGHYIKPGPWARFLALLFRIIPNAGPFRALSFKAPTPQTQKLFMGSFVDTLSLYREQLEIISKHEPLVLADSNFDTGGPSKFGTYRLADEACARLLIKLGDHKKEEVPADLGRALLRFYGGNNPGEPKAAEELARLRQQT